MPDKDLVWLHGEIKSPPLSGEARRTAGHLLRLVQQGKPLSLPYSRPMPSIGPGCHELRFRDLQQHLAIRVIYRIDEHEVIIGDVFVKKSQKTPPQIIDSCKRRFRKFDELKDLHD
jgi:phage-related protein